MKTMNKIFMYFFLVLGVIAIIGVCLGNWWHIVSAFMCIALALALKTDTEEEKAHYIKD